MSEMSHLDCPVLQDIIPAYLLHYLPLPPAFLPPPLPRPGSPRQRTTSQLSLTSQVDNFDHSSVESTPDFFQSRSFRQSWTPSLSKNLTSRFGGVGVRDKSAPRMRNSQQSPSSSTSGASSAIDGKLNPSAGLKSGVMRKAGSLSSIMDKIWMLKGGGGEQRKPKTSTKHGRGQMKTPPDMNAAADEGALTGGSEEEATFQRSRRGQQQQVFACLSLCLFISLIISLSFLPAATAGNSLPVSLFCSNSQKRQTTKRQPKRR